MARVNVPTRGLLQIISWGENNNKARGVYHGVGFTSGTYFGDLDGWDSASGAFPINSVNLRSKLEWRA